MKDNKFLGFLITTSIGGVFFLIPVAFLGFMLVQVAGVMMKVAKPLAGWLPVDTIGGVALANILALLAVLLVCFIFGLLARLALAGVLMSHLESKVLANLPGYPMIKSLVSGFDQNKAEGLKPVALQMDSAERIGFEVQKLQDGRSVVFIPSAPNPFSGFTQIVPSGQISYLDVPINMIIEATENYGHGMEKLLDARVRAS